MATPHLPSFRRRALSLSSLNVPRRYHWPISLLQYMCLVPAIIGFLHHLSRAWSPPLYDATHLFNMKSTPLIYCVAILWCLLAGYWSWILTTSMVRRWLYQYEVSNAVIRLVILNGINWTLSIWIHRIYGPDQPVMTWMVICGVLLFSNIFKLIWTAATSMDSKYRGKATTSSSSSTVSSLNNFKMGKGGEELHYKSTVVRVLVLPLTVVVFVTMFAMLYQVGQMRSTAGPIHMDIIAKPHPAFQQQEQQSMNNKNEDNLRVMVVVLSAWTPKSLEKRKTFRETTMQLIPKAEDQPGVTFFVQFVIGQPPTEQVRTTMGPLIDQEIQQYHDVLMLNTSDKYEDLSQKVYSAMEWTDQYQFDYLLKTDDDIFVRWDTISKELKAIGPQQGYWQGLAYWNIPPIRNTDNKNNEMNYPLPIFPPYTAGALYIVSRDIVRLITGVGGPRLFVKNEDQNLGIWLFPYNIRPIHDRRIQQIDACEEDMIAKHFGDFGEPGAIGGTMQDMLANIQQGRKMCQGFRTSVCAMCYPCHNKGTNWRDWNFDCHDKKGVTLLHPGPLTLVD
ncbi:galactosyltransferase-domain-containing protein [Halteromyces radiatus]|uniref:galactosyltransferase-domain-containing protein n=1 Tax=Halteromyces radiatus TaxID=101107 RepID=UPI00221EEC68|nr:galactosyltransferase-domain-containing protein [Halteromyces radiatus]KAI8089162.1 galactosyltransferase-domain-containing protein [Halteromyces radiatus]